MNTMIRKLTSIMLTAIILLSGLSFAETSIFVATDRHAKYETVNEEASAEGKDSPEHASPDNTLPVDLPHKKDMPPLKKKIPSYDSDGNLVWHNHLTEVLSLVSADGIQPEIVLLGGDNVGDGGEKSIDVTGYPIGAPYFSMTSVDAQVEYVFGDATKALYTYGSHDIHSTDPYETTFFSGPVAGNGYYIYGITYSQMIHDTDQQANDPRPKQPQPSNGKPLDLPPSDKNALDLQVETGTYDGKDIVDRNGISAQTASHHFLAWVNSLDDHLPIIVMSHVPLHAIRGDNAGAWTWTRALNAAAERHDIIFLWGHNHTVERRGDGKATERANYRKMPGETLVVQSWDADEAGKTVLERDDNLITQTETLGFIYMNAGYITNGVGSVLTFSDENENGLWDHLAVKRYALTEEEAEFSKSWVYELREAG